MDTGEDDESNLKHSKFWKAKRGAFQSSPQQRLSSLSVGSPGPSQDPELVSALGQLEPLATSTPNPLHSHHSSSSGTTISPLSISPSYFHGSGTSTASLSSAAQISPSRGLGQGQGQGSSPSAHQGFQSEVFRFDSTDRERYLCSAISEEEEVFSPVTRAQFSLLGSSSSFDSPCITISPLHIGEDSYVVPVVERSFGVAGGGVGPHLYPCSPYGGGSEGPPAPPSSSSTSPQQRLSPSSAATLLMEGQNRLMARVHSGLALLPPTTLESGCGLFGVPSSPVSPLTPNTPLSPSPIYSSDQAFHHGFLAELYKRRCHSDSDLPLLPESSKHDIEPTDLSVRSKKVNSGLNKPRSRKPIPHPLKIPPNKGGSLESDHSSPQDSPLDLSLRGSSLSSSPHHHPGPPPFGSSGESITARFLSSLANPLPLLPQSGGCGQGQGPGGPTSGVAVIRGDIASPTTRNSVAMRYNLDVSPVVEEMPPGTDMAFVCPVCGQMFSLHDRLAKHMASRHKSKPHDSNKSYPCDVCHRSFARSDMLTRHMRLHTGVKPYTCRVCGQVFSRSDHLSTHQRTHTGEKPYKCPQCPYSACRRDMITRHQRTHSRNSSSSSSDLQTPTSASSFSGPDSMSGEVGSLSGTTGGMIKLEPMSSSGHSRPPSSASSFAPDSPIPLSPNLNLSSLSVNSPSSPSFLE